MKSATPPPEVAIDEALLRGLLERQHPDLKDRSLVITEAGWDNVMVRLGDDLALRMPRRAVAEGLLLKEQRWLPELAPKLPLPIPVPLRVGVPDDTYPFHWSVLPWLRGEAADQAPPAPADAVRLADFLRALHQSAPATAPKNPSRDQPLSSKRQDIGERIEELEAMGEPVTAFVRQLWDEASQLPPPKARTWIEADLHARNVLVADGRLSAIIDWGDLCAGDPATDLASFWALFESSEARLEGLRRYGCSETMHVRAQGWAIYFGVILLHTGLQDTPRHAAMGRATLRRLNSR